MSELRQREPRERDPEYMGWIARLPCPACLAHGRYNTQVQVAHLRASSLEHDKRETGKSEKPHDKWTTPLCQPHHTGDNMRVRDSQHSMGELDFWALYGINPFDLCLELNAAFATGLPGANVIAHHVAKGKKARSDG